MSLPKFLTHSGNELATAVIERIAAGESAGFSPTLFVGPSGGGKSRVLKKMAEDFARNRPEALVTDTDGPTVRQWTDEIRKRTRGPWSEQPSDGRFHRYLPDDESRITEYAELRTILREADLVIIDNLDALKDQYRAQEELEFAIDALNYSGSAMVLGASAVPRADDGWNTRLLSQLAGGLIVEVALPDEQARRRFVLEWSADNGFPLPAESIDLIVAAETDFGAMRGRLDRLRLKARVERRPIVDLVVDDASQVDRETAETELAGVRSPGDICRIVARSYGIRTADLKSPDRHPGMVLPRHVAIWLCDRYSQISRNQIGKYFAGRDAATIRHAIRRIDTMRVADLAFDERLTDLESRITGRRDNPAKKNSAGLISIV
jgi:chromosomal replication initiator protein